MQLVLLTALGVGGATVFGTLLGFCFKNISHKFSDIVLSFAAGVMLAAAVIGLILPSLDYGGKFGLLFTIAGIFCGAVCLSLFDRLVPHLHKLSGVEQEAHPAQNGKLDKVLLFVTAIAIHNLPEGIAAGVGFGTGNNTEALTVAGGIALQFATGFTVAFFVYQIGTLITTGALGTAFVPGLIVVAAIAGVIAYLIQKANKDIAAEYALKSTAKHT